MSQYRVRQCYKQTCISEVIDSRAYGIWEKYGLQGYYSVQEVDTLWDNYSDSMAAGWMMDDKESVEQVFGVILEEIE